MADQRLLEEIRAKLSSGVPEEKIRQQLVSSGRALEDINGAMAVLKLQNSPLIFRTVTFKDSAEYLPKGNHVSLILSLIILGSLGSVAYGYYFKVRVPYVENAIIKTEDVVATSVRTAQQSGKDSAKDTFTYTPTFPESNKPSTKNVPPSSPSITHPVVITPVPSTSVSPPSPVTPLLTVSLEPENIDSGSSTVLSWNTENVDSCTSPNLSTVKTTKGKIILIPTKTETYSISCTGQGKTVSKSVTITITTPVVPPTPAPVPTPTPVPPVGIVYDADPTTFSTILAKATGGESIRLAPGNYGRVVIQKRAFNQPVTIIATGATFGPATGSGQLGYAFTIINSSNINIVDGTFADATRGVVIDTSTDITFKNPMLTRLQTDGLDVATSQRITVTGAVCTNFTPLPADHPDCIQGWSRPGGITSDVRIEGTTATGDMQGVTFFNHVRNGIDDGGFDRMSLLNNVVRTTFPQAVACYACRNSTIIGNDVKGLPPNTYKASVNFSGSGNTVCGNLVPDVPNSPAAAACTSAHAPSRSNSLMASVGSILGILDTWIQNVINRL